MQTQEQILLKVMNEAMDRKIAIKMFIEETAKIDAQLSEALKDKSKDFDKCWNYIVSKAKKELNGHSGYIQPSIVFGWAIHYFIEKDESLEKEVGSLNTVEKLNTEVLIDKPKPKQVKSKIVKNDKPTSIQLDLFSMMGDENQNEEVDKEEYEEDIDTTDE